MLAPCGLPRRLLLFDRDALLFAAYGYSFDAAEPLWCHLYGVAGLGAGDEPSEEPEGTAGGAAEPVGAAA